MKTEAESQGMHLQARDWQLPPEVGEKYKMGSSPEQPEGTNTHCQHLDWKFMATRTVKEYISVVLSHRVCDKLFRSSKK